MAINFLPTVEPDIPKVEIGAVHGAQMAVGHLSAFKIFKPSIYSECRGMIENLRIHFDVFA